MYLQTWCERGDLNSYGGYPLDPKSSASANSATLARRKHDPYIFITYGIVNISLNLTQPAGYDFKRSILLFANLFYET
jgi:hypothetical protein